MEMASRIIFRLICELLVFKFSLSDRLNEYISHYEVVVLNNLPHGEIGRQTKVNFNAFERKFQLILVPDSKTIDFATKLTIFGLNSTATSSTFNIARNVVRGHVKGILGSSVYGCIFSGFFSGAINTPEDTYFVEPITNYFNQSEIVYKFVIYRRSDVNITAFLCKNKNSCRFKKKFSENVFQFESLNLPEEKSEDVVKDFTKDIDDGESSGVKKVCTLRVIVDHVYYQKISSRTFESIISKLVVIFEGVDKIYRQSDFDGDGKPDGIGIKIVEFVIWWNKHQPGYKLSDEHLSNVNFIKLLSLEDFSDVCLGFAVTARDFGSSLGMAPPRQSDAGICAKRSVGGVSMNIAMATLFLGDEQLPDVFSEMVIAHEIGHSFGSGHDPRGLCSPSVSEGGPYLMNSVLKYTGLKNNRQFSSCSLANISQVVKRLGMPCLIEWKDNSSCGNGFVDSSKEHCDCGNAFQCDYIDSCCTPQGGILGDGECDYRRSAGAQCSHREDECCNLKCHIVPQKDQRHCNKKEVCKKPSFCDGISKDCPLSDNKPDGTPCRGELGKCENGICEEIVCKSAGLKACVCPEVKDDCHLCCQYEGLCVKASVLGLYMHNRLPYTLPDGELCLNGGGVCLRRHCQKMARSLNPRNDDDKPEKYDSSTSQLMGILVIVIVMNIGIVLFFLLIFCVYKKYKPIRKRHVSTTWQRVVMQRRAIKEEEKLRADQITEPEAREKQRSIIKLQTSQTSAKKTKKTRK